MKSKKELKEKLLEQYLKRKEYNKQYQKEKYLKVSVNVKRQDIEYAVQQILSLYPSLQKDDIQEAIEKYLACLKLKDEVKKRLPKLSLNFNLSYATFLEDIAQATTQQKQLSKSHNSTDTTYGVKI